MSVLNITATEISNATYINAFIFAVAKSMAINPVYIVLQEFLQLRRLLASSIFDLTFQIRIPATSNDSFTIINATSIELNLISKYHNAINAGDTLQYVKIQLHASGISDILFLILPVGQAVTLPPTFPPSTSSFTSGSKTTSNNILVIQLAAPFGSAFIAFLCVGAVCVVVRRRRSKGLNLAKKYKPVMLPTVDEEMSLGSIYSPKSDREDGFFSLNIENLRSLQNGEEFKANEQQNTTLHSTTVMLKQDTAFDMSTMEPERSNLSLSGASSAITSLFDGKSWDRKKHVTAEEKEFSLDSLYPENKPVSYSQFGPSSEKRVNQEDRNSQLNFHDVYPDRNSMDAVSSVHGATSNASPKKAPTVSPSKTSIFETPPTRKFGSKLPTPVDKINISGSNPMRRTPTAGSDVKNSTPKSPFSKEQLRKPAVDSGSAYRDQIIESKKQLRRLDPAAGNNPLRYQASRSNAMRTNAVRFADPVLSSSGAATKATAITQDEPPRRHEIPIVDVFKSVNVAQMSGLSPGIKFRLSKLKFEARSGEK